ncbi:helix-turn-helix domain-containing protein [Herbidospora galbida]|uniref:Helix-turn-helix domain-containing protein n=2 Tax=Herbidospora TaxID=28443 RepID=A0A4U3MCX3_9ACTN|nr:MULTISPECIES: helix-turn-helix domain-containing protein [Herbidospora]NAS21571.1 helix-turn-helix domain-containing protein [Herbidospora solisilvae]TKK85607.1 helix-turn-helix domain-containing protein [Herbidospora galbida]
MRKNDRLWSVDDLADFLGVPAGTIYQWRTRRTGPPGRKIGRHLKYLPEDVYAWVREQS